MAVLALGVRFSFGVCVANEAEPLDLDGGTGIVRLWDSEPRRAIREGAVCTPHLHRRSRKMEGETKNESTAAEHTHAHASGSLVRCWVLMRQMKPM